MKKILYFISFLFVFSFCTTSHGAIRIIAEGKIIKKNKNYIFFKTKDNILKLKSSQKYKPMISINKNKKFKNKKPSKNKKNVHKFLLEADIRTLKSSKPLKKKVLR